MVDATYQTKVYEKQGGAELVVASGGQITIESGGKIVAKSGGVIEVDTGGALEENSVDLTTLLAGAVANPAAGVGASYKIARGVHQQAAASDTIATGLTTVVAVVATWQDPPTLKQLWVTATIGDQAGSPAAGSILTKTYKPTATNDVTPIAATDFTDNLHLNWVAIGT